MQNPYRARSKIEPQQHWDRRIPTTTFRALLMAGLPGAHYQVVMHIIERTWGFNQESRPIPWREFTEATHISRRSVSVAVKDLEKQQIIVVKRNSRGSQVSDYLFNKYWDTWLTEEALDRSVILKGTGAENDTGAGNDTLPVQKTVPTGAENGTRPVQASSLLPSPGKKGKETIERNYRKKERDHIFALWNSVKVMQHRKLTDKRAQVIQAALKDHTVEEICQAIITYSKVQFGEEYRWDYRWTLEHFLNRGLERFIGDEEMILANYLMDKGGQDGRSTRGTGGPDTDRRGAKEPTDEQYRKSLRPVKRDR